LRDTAEIGGPGKTILETFRAIDATRFELHLALYLARYEHADMPVVAAAREYGLPVHIIRGFNQYDPRLISRTAALAARLGADIVHSHEAKSDAIAYATTALRRHRIMTTLHGWIGNSAKQRLMIALDKRLVRKFDCVIAVSGPIRDEIVAAGMPTTKLMLLHNAIVLDRYRRTGQRGALASMLGRPLTGPVITTIGRMSPEKGHADLVEALGIVAAAGTKVSAVMVGDGPERPRLEQRIRALGLESSVHLPGYLDQPQRILEESDLVVLPSHTEGLPNAALEALAMEVPVLATRVGGTPEVITDGETGRLVPPGSPEALAAEILSFVADPAPWKQFARQGRAVVERQFDFRARTRKLEAIYANVMAAVRS
jgi:glycosyltransferase involved in cell wall biosynthesis